MSPPQTNESTGGQQRETSRTTTHRRAFLAVSGATAVTGCAGFVRNSKTETPDGSLPIQVTNQLTKQVMAEWGGYPDDGISVGVEVAEIDSETLAETQLFEREIKMERGNNPRWESALTIEESADEYVLKAWGLNEFSMNGKPLHDTIMRFKPSEVGEKIGEKLDVWVGDTSDRRDRGRIGFVIEPEERPLA